MIVLRMESDPPLTEFAPHYNIPIGVQKYLDINSINEIKKFLLKKEEEILKKIPYDYDGGTEAGKNSVTGRFLHYNLFNFIPDCKELQGLFDFLKESYFEFINQENLEPRETEIVGWFNALRKGERIHEHSHGFGNDVYLSGNIILDDVDTHTRYRCPYNYDTEIPVLNSKGLLTIFPSYVYHYSDTYEGDDVRHSIAFDIRIPGIEDNTRKAIKFT